MGTGWSQKLFVSSTLLLLLTVYNLLKSAAMLLLFLSSIVIFMVTALLNLLTACLPSSSGLAAPDFLLTLTPFLSNSLMQELTSIFIPSSLSLVNSGSLFLNLYFHLPRTYTPSKEECQGTSSPKLATLWKSPTYL